MTAWQPLTTAPKAPLDEDGFGPWFLVANPHSPMAWAPYEFAAWNSHQGAVP